MSKFFIIVVSVYLLLGGNIGILSQEHHLAPDISTNHEIIEVGASSPKRTTVQPFRQLTTSKKSANVNIPISVACVFMDSSQGINDSVNMIVYAGLQKAEAEGLCTFTYAEPTDPSQYQGLLNNYASSGSFDLIIARGYPQIWAVNETAKSYPNQSILFLEWEVEQGNVSSVLFKEHEGSFLAGAMAGLMTQTGKVGFIGGIDVPMIRKFWAGYTAGVLYEKNNSNIEVIQDFVGAFNDPTTGKNIAEEMWVKGVDIIFTAAGMSGDGVLESANEQGKGFYAIGGNDFDQDYLYPGRILCSVIKRVDIAVYNAIKDVCDSSWSAGVKLLGLSENGVGLSSLNYTKDIIGPDFIHEVNVTVRNKIINDDLSVPTNATELTQWITDMGIVGDYPSIHDSIIDTVPESNPSDQSIENHLENPNYLLFQVILTLLLIGCAIAAGFYFVKTKKFKAPSFTDYFQSDKIEFLKSIHHKAIIGLESIQTAIMSEVVVTPLLEEPTMSTSLVTWFPDEYRVELKTKLKGRTILTLIEIAFQYSEDTNLTNLAQALDIPTSTLSDELKKLVKLNYLDYHKTPRVLHDGRYRHYIITAKGISFLKIMKSALELSIRRAKEKKYHV